MSQTFRLFFFYSFIAFNRVSRQKTLKKRMSDSIFELAANENFVKHPNRYEDDDEFRKQDRRERRRQLQEKRSVISSYASPRRENRSRTSRRRSVTPTRRDRRRRSSPAPTWDRRSFGRRTNNDNTQYEEDRDSRAGDWDDWDDNDMEQRQHEIEEYRKLAENDFKITRNAASTIMQTVSAGGELVTSALGIDLVNFNGLPKKIKKAIKKGNFDSSVRTFSKSAIGRTIIESGSIGIIQFLSLVMENHLEEEKKKIRGSKRGFKKKRRKRRSRKTKYRSPSPSTTEPSDTESSISSSSSSSSSSDGVHKKYGKSYKKAFTKKKKKKQQQIEQEQEEEEEQQQRSEEDLTEIDESKEVVDETTGRKRPILGADEPPHKEMPNILGRMTDGLSKIVPALENYQENQEEREALEQERENINIPEFQSLFARNDTP